MSQFCRRIYLLALMSVVGCSLTIATARSEEAPTLPPRPQFHLFLLVGQSNMAGRGNVADEDRQPIPW